MKWINTGQFFSTLSIRLSVDDYKSDYKFNFDERRIESGMVSKQDAFIQKFKKVLSTNETPTVKYGLAHLLPTSLNQSEFNQQCIELTEAIFNHQFSDSKPNSPNGLGHTVEKVYEIEYDSKSQRYTFAIGVTGAENIITLSLPSPSQFS